MTVNELWVFWSLLSQVGCFLAPNQRKRVGREKDEAWAERIFPEEIALRALRQVCHMNEELATEVRSVVQCLNCPLRFWTVV